MASRPADEIFANSHLPADVRLRLEAWKPDPQSHKVLILPTQTRSGETHYLASDIVALKLAKAAGLDAAYLVPSSDRTYLEEYSAEWVLELGLAVLQTLTMDTANAMASYLWQRAKYVVDNGIHPGPPDAVPIRLSLAKYDRRADGSVLIEDLLLEGSPESVNSTIRALTGSPKDSEVD